jgi:hypothetical protein
LVELALEDNEFLAFLGAKVDQVLLELLESIGHLVEILLLEEEVEVSLLDLGGNLLHRNHQSVLLVVASQ